MLVVVDYGIGNLNSVLNLCNRLQVKAMVSQKADDILAADHLILPGVGHFGEAMKNLRQSGLVGVLEKQVFEKNAPLMGLCVGMQLLAKKSEEGNADGLGWIEAEVIRFRFSGSHLRIPHVGFNTVAMKQSKLFKYLEPVPRFYFTHSYHMNCAGENYVIGNTNYGYDFASVVQNKNIFGTQFHPEKSHRFGINLIRGFLEIF